MGSQLFILLILFFTSTSYGEELSLTKTSSVESALSRLEKEAALEDQSHNWRFLPLQVSSLSLSLAALYQLSAKGDYNKQSSLASPVVGLTVGSGWLVASTLMGMYYLPYQSELKLLESSLSKEVDAERAIEETARLGRRLNFLSFFTQLGSSLYLIQQTPSGSSAITLNVIALASSFLPLIWYYHWFNVAEDVEKGKSTRSSVSISPLFQTDKISNELRGSLTGGLLVTIHF